MLLTNVILLSVGLWAIWTGLKVCEQVYGITLILTGLIVLGWGLTFSPLWLQIVVELLVVVLGQLFSKLYIKEFFLNRTVKVQSLSRSRFDG